MATAPDHLSTGHIIRQRYRVITRLGGGGMGDVYEVEHLRTHRVLAMKVLKPELARRPEMVQRFAAEARAAAALAHPAMVEIVDLDSDGDLNFIVMDRLTGEELDARMAREGPLPFSFVASLGAAIADGISTAHRHRPRIIHRDLKPQNIFLARKGGEAEIVKILDFGIAKLAEMDDPEDTLTRTGEVCGTPIYMSPEQLRSSKDVDERTDIYAIGVILYQALTGQTPFHATSFADLVLQVATERPAPIATLRPDVPAGLASIVERAMAPSREERFGSAEELAQALSPYRETSRPPSLPPEPAAPSPGDAARLARAVLTTLAPPARLPKRRAAVAGAAAVLCVLGATAIWWRAHRATSSIPSDLLPTAAPAADPSRVTMALRGRILRSKASGEVALTGVSVSVEGGGGTGTLAVTRPDGVFELRLPVDAGGRPIFKPGSHIRLYARKPGYRMFPTRPLVIVAGGSEMSGVQIGMEEIGPTPTREELTQELIPAMFDRIRDDVAPKGASGKVVLGQFIDAWAIDRGYAKREVHDALARFAAAASSSRNADALERSQASYVQGEFARAAALAKDATSATEERLGRLPAAERAAGSDAALASLKAEGDAAYTAQDFSGALAAYQRLLGQIDAEARPVMWARTWVDVGTAEQDLSERAAGPAVQGHLERARMAHDKALTVLTADAFPEYHADAQTRLGRALTAMGLRREGKQGRDLLAAAVASFERASKVADAKHLGREWSKAQNFLGGALRRLGSRTTGAEGKGLLKQGVSVYDGILQRFREEQLQAWGALLFVEFNLGNGLLELGARTEGSEGLELLRRAIRTFEHTLARRAAAEDLGDWGVIVEGIRARAIHELANRTPQSAGEQLLAEAAKGHQRALRLGTLEQTPQRWAWNQHQLGNVHRDLGQRAATAALAVKQLRAALAAYDLTLDVLTREHLPEEWATTQSDRGSALVALAARSADAQGIKLLGDAVEALERALQVLTIEHQSEHWAATQNRLASALTDYGQRIPGPEGIQLIRRAVQAAERALSTVSPDDALHAGNFQFSLGEALRQLSNRTPGAEGQPHARRAAEAFRHAADADRQQPERWARAHRHLALAAGALGDWPQVVASATTALSVTDTEELVNAAGSALHDKLFHYQQAYELYARFVRSHPGSGLARVNLAQACVTTARSAAARAEGAIILAQHDLPAQLRVVALAVDALAAIDLQDRKAASLRLQALESSLTALIRTLGPQLDDVPWIFEGTLRFVQTSPRLARDRAWLDDLFSGMQAKDIGRIRAAIARGKESTSA